MQRRAAAIYAVFFLVVAIGAYTATTVAQEPSIHLDGGHNYTQNDTITVGDRAYTVGNISSGSQGPSTQLNYTNDSARLTLTIQNNSNVTRFSNGSYRPLASGESPPSGGGTNSAGGGGSGTTGVSGGANASVESANVTSQSGGNPVKVGPGVSNASNATNATSATGGSNASANASSGASSRTASIGTRNESVSVYQAVIENGSDNTTRLSLHEVFNLTALLREDSAVANTTLSGANDTRYVRYLANNTTRPVESYLPESHTRNFTNGDEFQYGNNSTTITTLSKDGATISWNGTRTTTTEVEEGANVTLGGTEQKYVAHFPDNSTLKLTEDLGAYQEELAAIDEFHERIRGFWGVVIISVVTAFGLIGLSYLPERG